jgi:uncharacterized protein DUF4824
MRRLGPLLAATLLLLTNAVVLVGVAYNRQGEPEARVTLTERELRLGYQQKEDTGMWLRLDTTDAERWAAAGPGWFDQKRLEEIGFDCSLAPADKKAELFYEKALPRHVYAVLEFDGEAWKSWIARRERELLNPAPGTHVSLTFDQRKKLLEAERAGHSRLFVVDVGLDPAVLRSRYPDRSQIIVTGAVARLRLERSWDESTKTWKDERLEGFVSEILPSEVHVPLDRRQVLDDVKREQLKQENPNKWMDYGEYAAHLERPPRFEVTLTYGRRLESWIDDVQPLATPPATDD